MTKNISWTQIEKKLINQDKNESITFFKNLYNLSGLNKKYLISALFDTEIERDDSEDTKKIKSKIRKCFFSGNGPNMAHAKSLLSSYIKESLTLNSKVDMMLHYCETGTDFGVTFGADMESLYASVEKMFDKFIKEVQKLEVKKQLKYKDRVLQLLKNASHCGYGHEDSLQESLDEWIGFENL